MTRMSICGDLTASPTAAYGTAGVTLGGKISAGSVYPPSGENIVVSINGAAQTNTIADSTGDFSFSCNLLNIPFSAATYTITYSYGGDASFNSASDASKTITITTNTITENLFSTDPAGYYPYVTQCNTGWQAVPAS